MGEDVCNSKVEQEYLEIMTANNWMEVYQKIGLECQKYQYTWNEAKKPKNKTLNRYRDVNPYDHTRVVLKRNDNDYINANFVTMPRANRRYILTQGPLAFTMGHFWLMVWEQNTRAILMLNKVIEKNELKCHRYWPQQVGAEEICKDVGLNITLIKEEDFEYYGTRVIRLYDHETNTTREVMQYHYTTWPDFGVPASPVQFVRFLRRVRDSGVLDNTHGPAVVHCSAGIGRSGTLCLVDTCLVIVENEGIDKVDIQGTLVEMRQHRMGLIQTPDQLRFCYQAVLEGAKRLDPCWSEETVSPDSVYAHVRVADSESADAAPPLPPPRGESLGLTPPARPLPTIPKSTSEGDLDLSAAQDSSSSDETPPTPSGRESPSPATSAASSADDEADEPSVNTRVDSKIDEGGSPLETLRRRKNRELAERVAEMRKRVKEAERWHTIKRSLYKPLTITFGFILAGIIVYAYVKH